jgi:hypothetical protein
MRKKLLGMFSDLNCHGLDIALGILLSWNWWDFHLQRVLANRGVGGVPVEGDSGSIGASHKNILRSIVL